MLDPLQRGRERDILYSALLEDPALWLPVGCALVCSQDLQSFVQYHCCEIRAAVERALVNGSHRLRHRDALDLGVLERSEAYLLKAVRKRDALKTTTPAERLRADYLQPAFLSL